MSMIYLIYPNLVMTYSKYPKTYFIYYPLKSLVPQWLSFPRSPKDFQELLLGSAVYVGVGPGAGPKESPGSWVIATSREQPIWHHYDNPKKRQKKNKQNSEILY